MIRQDKELAESILRDLCVGRGICGMNFYAVPVLVIDEVTPSKRESFVTVESDWIIYDGMAMALAAVQSPNGPVDSARTSMLIREIADLAWQKIIGVKLGDEIPDLFIEFENGKVLKINGHHDKFESWNVSAGKFLVVAVPGDDVAIWQP